MFAQIIRGKVSDPDAVRPVVERWMKELGPNATGWLGSTSGVTEDGRFSHATIQLLRDLLDRELQAQQLSKELDASPVQALQRDLKARDKKLEDLTKQLEALKQIDRKIREKTLSSRPSKKTTPSGKENR